MKIRTLLLAGVLCASHAGVTHAEQTGATKAAQPSQTPQAILIDRVVAVVNNDIILLRDFLHRVERMRATQGKPKMPAKQMAKRALTDLINDSLIMNVARRLRITASKRDIDLAVAQLKKSNKLNDTQLAHALQARGYTMARYRQELALQILRIRTINIAVKPRLQITEAELKVEYKKLVKKLGQKVVKPFSELRKTLHERMFQRDILKYTQMWLGELRSMAYVSVRL